MSDEQNEQTELSDRERSALEAWAPLAPPAGFADRVLAAREIPAVRSRLRRRWRWRWPMTAAAIGAAGAAAAVIAIVVNRAPAQGDSGQVAATRRTTALLGRRAVAVAEAEAELRWRVDADGAASIDQTAGDVFYRVDRGGPFVVHTPAGDVQVTGTCFRVEILTMNKRHVILSAAAGAAIASAAVVTVYEGKVIAGSRGSRSELEAGTRATLTAAGTTAIAAASATAPGATASLSAADAARATREELIARDQEQRLEIGKLRARVAELEDRDAPDRAKDGRPWHDPSPEELAAWVTRCHVRTDEPSFSRWQPIKPGDWSDRGVEPGELADLNAALTEIQQKWKALVRALYLEATGDTGGADTLSLDAMRNELHEKSAPAEHNLLLQRIAMERAGQATPPADLSRVTPYERYLRAYLALGGETEAAIARRLGPERAKAIRGDGWGSRSDMSGCPTGSAGH